MIYFIFSDARVATVVDEREINIERKKYKRTCGQKGEQIV